MNKNESGFSIVEIVLIVVVIILLVVVGWFVYKNYHKTTKAITMPTNSSGLTKNSTSSVSGTTISNVKYLTINQWDIRAPYTSSDSLSYVIENNNPYIAVIISKNLADNYGCSGINNLPSGAGAINRNLANATPSVMTTATTYSQLATIDPTDYKQIGNYVYGFVHDQAACSAQTEANTPGNSISETANSFTNSLIDKLEPIPSN